MGAATILDGVRVEEQIVPLPKSVSAEAQRYLAGFVSKDGKRIVASQSYPPAGDLEAWDALKLQANERLGQAFAAVTANLKTTCQTVEIEGATVHVAKPIAAPRNEEQAYLYMHGGALLFGEGELARYGACSAAELFGVSVYSVDYRTPPHFPYPAPLDDCVAAYRGLLKSHSASNIIIAGSSAGGNLAAATVLRARDEGLPLPSAVVLITPELDLTESGDSFETNKAHDLVLSALMPVNLLYAAGHELSHPYLSPLFGDFAKGFPPTFIQAGTRDLFLSNAVRMHRALRRARIHAELHVFEGMPHGGFRNAPEDLELSAELGRFVAKHWETPLK